MYTFSSERKYICKWQNAWDIIDIPRMLSLLKAYELLEVKLGYPACNRDVFDNVLSCTKGPNASLNINRNLV